MEVCVIQGLSLLDPIKTKLGREELLLSSLK